MNRALIYRAAAFLAALASGTVAGCLIQTQFNLAAIAGLGVDIAIGDWIATILHDLGGFSPLYGSLLGLTLLVALPVAALLHTRVGRGRGLIFAAAGAIGLLCAFAVGDRLAPMPTLIAATRGPFGTATMLLSGLLAAWLYAHLTRDLGGAAREVSP